MVLVTNGKMAKKLLYKTLKVYIIFSVCTVLVAAPLFYFLSKQISVEDSKTVLLKFKMEFERYNAPSMTEKDIAEWNKVSRYRKILPNIPTLRNDSIFNAVIYDSLGNANNEFLCLMSPVVIDNKVYTYSIRRSLVESQILIKNIFFLFFAILCSFLIGLYIITRRLSNKLMMPFYETLLKIENFEIDKSYQPPFPDTDIEEFNRLNQSIEKLINKNTSIYHNQSEFIENAAHELQTPLAIFQAKIDMLIQRADITEEQSEILISLNNVLARLNRLNKNLLLLSKIDNKIYSEKHIINVNECIEKHLDFFIEQGKSKEIAFTTEFTENIFVMSNPVLFEVLMSNLSLNAIRHNVQNGEVKIKLSNNCISISNTGCQTALVVDRLYNRFSKLNQSKQGNG